MPGRVAPGEQRLDGEVAEVEVRVLLEGLGTGMGLTGSSSLAQTSARFRGERRGRRCDPSWVCVMKM
jgi:hypothetical protein